jgi:hypothetical protein
MSYLRVICYKSQVGLVFGTFLASHHVIPSAALGLCQKEDHCQI